MPVYTGDLRPRKNLAGYPRIRSRARIPVARSRCSFEIQIFFLDYVKQKINALLRNIRARKILSNDAVAIFDMIRFVLGRFTDFKRQKQKF